MPKPLVHLIGPPLEVALDARITGDKARFVCSAADADPMLSHVLLPAAPRQCRRTEKNHVVDMGKTTLSFTVFASKRMRSF